MSDTEKNCKTFGDFCEDYGNDYLNWKSWNSENFGVLNKSVASYYSSEIKRTKRSFGKNTEVLEIGFGNGEFLAYAVQNGWNIYGTEMNHGLVKVAEKKGFNVRRSENLSSFNENSFDLVVAFDVLEHIPQENLLNFFNEVRRVLKDEGCFIAKFPNGDSPFGLKYQNGDITHVTTIGSGKVRYFANKSNMNLVYVGGEAQPLTGISGANFIHRIIALPIKKLMNVFVNVIFYPRVNIDFCSSNLTMIYKVLKSAKPQL